MSASNGNGGRKDEGSRVVLPKQIDDWDEYFLWIAEVVSRKSKDPKSQVGAVIVSADRVVLATGYNGLARGVFDSEDILADVSEKLKWICHAEMNAIANAARIGISVAGGCVFVNKFPCIACCNAIVQAGIKRVCTHDDDYWHNDPADSEQFRKQAILKQSGIEVVAPFHYDFKPKKPVGSAPRRGPRKALVSTQARTHSNKRLPTH